ncbi:hypothetical protein [Rhodococcus sp. OK302]|nr:hypothetical protein [Rhodococcus sp. OK302]
MSTSAEYTAADYRADTIRYAGPFCSCGDYSCPRMDDSAAKSVNRDDY